MKSLSSGGAAFLPMMSPLRGFVFFDLVFYNDAAPDGAHDKLDRFSGVK